MKLQNKSVLITGGNSGIGLGIATPVFSRLGLSEDEATAMKEEFAGLIPMKRTGSPGEMGGVAAFLASSDSSFVVGEEIVADGGVVNL